MVVSPWVWIAFVAFVLGALALDLGLWHRVPRVIETREAARRTAIWILLALVFAGLLAWREGVQTGIDFLTGYTVEQALSVDNVVVMAWIFSSLAIPPTYQQRVLLWGVLGAMIMRGGFIILGLLLLTRFIWVEYVLGAVLLLAAVRVFRHQEPETLSGRSLIVRLVEHVIPVDPALLGSRWIARDEARDNRWAASPLLIALDPHRADRHRVRDRFDPGDLRDYACAVHRFHGDHFRDAGPSLALLPRRCSHAWHSLVPRGTRDHSRGRGAEDAALIGRRDPGRHLCSVWSSSCSPSRVSRGGRRRARGRRAPADDHPQRRATQASPLPTLDRVSDVEENLEVQLFPTVREVERRHLGLDRPTLSRGRMLRGTCRRDWPGCGRASETYVRPRGLEGSGEKAPPGPPLPLGRPPRATALRRYAEKRAS